MRILTSEILNKENEEVELAGWIVNRRDHGKLCFLDLEDRKGVVQMVATPAIGENYQLVDKLRSGWVVKIIGAVKKRPEKMVNKDLVTGQYEIDIKNLEILNESKTSPFDLSESGYEIGEEVRMKYRYLDLRRPRLRNNLRARARIIKFIRDFLTNKEFVEVETPILTKSTPEGARDYLVPSRLGLGKFYALPQSPQQYKQLLMVAGLERYFQIPRCFRDEDTRGDRQPEFTQLDIEMSFVSQDEILDLTEELILSLIKTLYPQKKIKLTEAGKILRLPYQEVFHKYQTDKPDLRENKDDPDELALLFVVNFPVFEWREEEKRWDAVHHPFTQPMAVDVKDFTEQFKKDPSKMVAYQYDLVLNGFEIGGGSLRIHKPLLLMAVFEAMGNKPEEIKEKFRHLVEAFEYGVPPHGGIALGLDRLIMILQNEINIREIMAFPKTGDGRDLMMDSPATVDEKQLKELGLTIRLVS